MLRRQPVWPEFRVERFAGNERILLLLMTAGTELSGVKLGLDAAGHDWVRHVEQGAEVDRVPDKGGIARL